MLRYFFILLLACLCLNAAAEHVVPATTLSGTVTDAVDNEPLTGVTIQITELSMATMTDIDGRYHFENLPPKTVTIQVSYIGHQTIIRKVNLSATTHLDFTMHESNAIRERSNAERASMGGSKALSTKAKRRSAILEERAKEFACEADRRWDLIRWGIYLDAMNALGGSDDSGVNKNRTERNLLFPLPQQEINTNSAINGNNPGWQ